MQPVEIKVTDHRRHTPTGAKTVGNGGSGAGGDELSVVVSMHGSSTIVRRGPTSVQW